MLFGITQNAYKAQSVTGFSIFCTLYMTAFLLDVTEEWEYPGPALISLILVLVVCIQGVQRWSFFMFLVLSTAHTLAYDFPDLGNHNNIFLICNLILMTGTLYASLRYNGTLNDEDLFDILKPPLRVILSLVYFFAGFHKLNADFFDPAFGCAAEFSRSLAGVFRMPDIALPHFAVFASAIAVLVWEIGGGLMLWLRKLQAPVLLVCWFMHSLLAQMVFFDFSSLAFALLLVFVPRLYWNLIKEKSIVRLSSIRLHRVELYLYINIIAAIAAGIYFWIHGYQPSFHRWQGRALVLASLVFIWPMLEQIFKGPERVRWKGVVVWDGSLPRWWLVFPLFVIFFGMNPYLGLRTAGTFTMFSNLVTEGDRSNHWLFASNPLKFWGYQEDTVEIIDIDPSHAATPRQSLTGYLLPVVEFKKKIYGWQKNGASELRAVFRYNNQIYQTDDLVMNNPWNIRERDWEMYLLDFRVIQKSPTANRCRW